MSKIYKLLSILRGYGLQQPNYFPILLGYGKDDEKQQRDRYNEQRKKTLSYVEDTPTSEIDSITKWINYFSHPSVLFNEKIWSRTNERKMLENLNAFIRQIILFEEPDFKLYTQGLEDFLGSIVPLATEEVSRIEKMDQSEYDDYREDCRDSIKQFLDYWRITQKRLSDDESFKRFVLDYIVLLTPNPNDYEINFDRFSKIMTDNYENDLRYLDIDLDETFEEDQDDIYEEMERPTKRRKEIDLDDDDFEPISGSGFYNWWL